jgi:tetratricopeptide (TPR) repeat protein
MKQALALAPNNDGLKIATAFSLVENGSNEEAVRLLKSAKDSAMAATLLGIAGYAMGEFKDAEIALNHAIHLDKNFEPAYRSLAQIALASSATPSSNTIASLCPWDKIVCSALQLREARDTHDDAKQLNSVAALRRASTGNAVAHCALGQAYSWASDWNSARQQLESCVTLDPSPQHHYQLAMAYQHLGQKQLAREELAARAKLLGKQTEEAVAGKQALEDLKH